MMKEAVNRGKVICLIGNYSTFAIISDEPQATD